MFAGAVTSKRGFRLRNFNKANLLAWLVSLDRNGYILCSFQNCMYLALDIDEMKEHYAFCSQEKNLSNFCEFCQKSCGSYNRLLIHKIFHHSSTVSFDDMLEFQQIQHEIIFNSDTEKKISCAMRRFWGMYLDQKKYLKCLNPSCFYVTQSLEDMENHFQYFCVPEEREKLHYSCPECCGRFASITRLKDHLHEVHPPKIITEFKISEEFYTQWNEMLREFFWAKCFHENCNYIDCSMDAISAHYSVCTGLSDRFVKCQECYAWLLNGQKLAMHIIDVHHPAAKRTGEFIEKCFPNSIQLQDTFKLSPQPVLESSEDQNSDILLLHNLDDEVKGNVTIFTDISDGPLKVQDEENEPKVYSRNCGGNKMTTIPNIATNFSNNYIDSSEDTTNSISKTSCSNTCNTRISQIAAQLAPCSEAPVVPVNISLDSKETWTLHVPQAPPPSELEGLPSFEKRFWDNVLLEMEDLIMKAAPFTSIRNIIPHYKKCSDSYKLSINNCAPSLVSVGIDYAHQGLDNLDRINYKLPELMRSSSEEMLSDDVNHDQNDFLISDNARSCWKTVSKASETISRVPPSCLKSKPKTSDCHNLSLTAKKQPSNDSTVSSSTNSRPPTEACDNSQGNSSHNSPPPNNSSSVVNDNRQMFHVDSTNSSALISDSTSLSHQSLIVDTAIVKEEPTEVSESDMISTDPLCLTTNKSNGETNPEDPKSEEDTLDVHTTGQEEESSDKPVEYQSVTLNLKEEDIKDEETVDATDQSMTSEVGLTEPEIAGDIGSSGPNLNSTNESAEMDEPVPDERSSSRRKSKVVRKLNQSNIAIQSNNDVQISDMYAKENCLPESTSTPVKQKQARKRKAEIMIPEIVMEDDTSFQKSTRQRKCRSSAQYIIPEDFPDIDDPMPVTLYRSYPRKRKSTNANDVLLSLGPRVSAGTELNDPKEMVTCFTCKETMPVKFYQTKHILQHTFICWLEGEQPLPVDDYPAMTLYLNRWKKIFPKFPLACPKCSQVKKSSVGFISHYQFCGKSSEEVNYLKSTCPVCTRMFKPSNIDQHLITNHLVRSDIPMEPETKRRKRSYNKNDPDALMKLFSENDEILPSDLVDTNIASAPEDYSVLKNQWKDALAKNNIIICPYDACDFAAGTLPEMRKHYKTCSLSGSLQPFICKECNFKAPTREALKVHVKNDHNQNQTVQTTPTEIVCPIPALKEVEDQLYSSCSYLRQSSFFRPAIQWTADLRVEVLTKDVLFPDMVFLSDSWNILNNPSKYMPTLGESVMMKFESSEWNRLQLYGTLSEPGSSSCIFTGGPISAMAWVPTPDGAISEQYLAIASQLKPGLQFEIGKTYNEPSIIQLWSYGFLVNNRTRETEPKLVWSLCVDGCVWDLNWCPSGAHDDRRLGILAAALSNGEIHVFPVPHPHQLPSIEVPMYYRYNAQMKLLPRAKDISQCKRVGWAKVKPHNLIVGGYANGMVAVWNLSVSSTLLRQGNALYPCMYFKAHHSIITGVSMCPVSNHFLLTASMDRNVHLWDLRALDNPLQTVNKGTYTDVEWLTHWSAFVSASDAGYVNATSTGLCSSVRDGSFITAQVLNSYATTSMSISVCDWLNGAAFSLEDGNVVGMLGIRHMGSGTESTKKRTKYIVQCKLTRLAKTETKKKLLKSPSAVQDVPTDSSSYEETASMFGLHFSLSRRVEDSLKNMKSPEDCRYDVYSIQCANKVCFNPNVQSFLTLSVGYESGFVLVPSLLMPSNSTDLVNSFLPKEKS